MKLVIARIKQLENEVPGLRSEDEYVADSDAESMEIYFLRVGSMTQGIIIQLYGGLACNPLSTFRSLLL